MEILASPPSHTLAQPSAFDFSCLPHIFQNISQNSWLQEKD